MNRSSKLGSAAVQIGLFVSVWFSFTNTAQAQIIPNGADPTEAFTRADFSFEYAIRDFDNLFVMRFAGDCAIGRWGVIGIEIPLVSADILGSKNSGLGDVELKSLVVFHRNLNAGFLQAFAMRFDFRSSTGSIDNYTGLGQRVLAPAAIWGFYSSGHFGVFPTIAYRYSLDNDDDLLKIHDLSSSVLFIDSFQEGYWIEAEPELRFDLARDDPPALTMRGVFGKMLNQNAGLNLDYRAHLAGQRRFDHVVKINLRYLFE
jgi:hypothetical protein